jgi:hypothetical protein
MSIAESGVGVGVGGTGDGVGSSGVVAGGDGVAVGDNVVSMGRVAGAWQAAIRKVSNEKMAITKATDRPGMIFLLLSEELRD